MAQRIDDLLRETVGTLAHVDRLWRNPDHAISRLGMHIKRNIACPPTSCRQTAR